MKKPGTPWILLLLLPVFAGMGAEDVHAGYSDRILRTSTRTALGLGQILPDLRGKQLIFMGEQHNNSGHHDLQLRVLRTLHNLGTPVTVGLEMFTTRDQGYLDSWTRGSISAHEFRAVHERNWGNTWDQYRNLYRYARDQGIPLIGLNVPGEIISQVARKGLSSLTSEQRSQLPAVSCPVDDDYMNFIRKALSVHGPPGGGKEFERFCEAQLIWDTAMALSLVRYLENNPGTTVVVMAGNSHSWRPGIPGQLARFRTGIDYRIILPEVPPVQTRHNISMGVTDYLWLEKQEAE